MLRSLLLVAGTVSCPILLDKVLPAVGIKLEESEKRAIQAVGWIATIVSAADELYRLGKGRST